MSMVNIAGIDKAELLVALYGRARQQGLGVLCESGRHPLPIDEARKLLDNHPHPGLFFDYLNGRVMKVRLGDDDMDTWAYDRDNGAGAAEEVIRQLRVAA